jgi:hypothetical protein
MKAQGGDEVELLLIHDLGTRWRRVVSVTSRPRFTPGEGPPTLWTGGWVGPRVDLDTEGRGKILFCLRRVSNLDRPVCSQILYCLSYSSSIVVK